MSRLAAASGLRNRGAQPWAAACGNAARLHRRRLGWLVALGFALLAVACSESGKGANSTASSGSAVGQPLPCAIDAWLEKRCRDCHAATPQFGAPVPLLTTADLSRTTLDGTSTIGERVLERIQAEVGTMPPPPNPQATAVEIQTYLDWLNAGMPARKADAMCGGSGGAGGGAGGAAACETPLRLSGKMPFEMPADSADEQVCFGIDIPGGAKKRHITAIRAAIDNSSIVHHVLLLQAPESVSSEPKPCGFTEQDWKLLYAWGPGTPELQLPAAAGYPVEADEITHYVIQLHYNNLQMLSGQKDQSAVELCLTESLREHDADIMAFGGLGFTIPPNANHKLACKTAVPTQLGSVLPVTVFQAWPHMHYLGTSLKTWVERAGGGVETMVDVDNYDFNYQVTYPTNMKLDVGDVIHTTCGWKNTLPQSVQFGEDTNDEMCFNFVSYYPRIETSAWHWLVPSALADCQAE